VRYLLPVAVVIAIEAAVALVAAGRAARRRYPGLRPWLAAGYVLVAAYGGVQLLDTTRIPCDRIGFLAGRVRDVKVVPPLALHADEPLDRFTFILPGQPVPPGLDVIVVPREQQVVPS